MGTHQRQPVRWKRGVTAAHAQPDEAASPSLPEVVRDHIGHQLQTVYASLTTEAQPQRLLDLIAQLDVALAGQDAQAASVFRRDLLATLPDLRSFAMSLVLNQTRADDLVQETLLKAWKSQDRFVPGTNLKAWLFTIMRNQFYNEHRKRGREVQDEDGAQAERMVSLPEQGGHLDLSDVRSALDRLAPSMRQALVLVAIENLTYEETAAVMNCRIGTVKSRVWRARTQLAEMLGYDGLEVGSDDVMLAAAGPKARRSASVS